MYKLCLLAFLSAAVLWAADSQLIDAVKSHDKDAVNAILKSHADVNAPEPDGTTALQWAAHNNDLETR